jgi:serine/threonine-protein kinase
MAPEQVEEASVDRRADVFALGAVLFEAIGGRRAFTGDDDASVMSRILTAPPDTAPVAEACPALAPVVQRALAKRPEDRFPTAQELAKAVTAAVAPADEDDVKALVSRLFTEDLTRLRERIAASVARVSSADEGVEPESAGASAPPPTPPPRAWVWPALGLAGRAALLVAFVLGLGGGDGGAHVGAGAGAVASSSSPAPTSRPVSQPSASAASPSTTPDPARSTVPSATVEPVSPARTTAPARRTASPASASATKPDLHPSPYASSP